MHNCCVCADLWVSNSHYFSRANVCALLACACVAFRGPLSCRSTTLSCALSTARASGSCVPSASPTLVEMVLSLWNDRYWMGMELKASGCIIVLLLCLLYRDGNGAHLVWWSMSSLRRHYLLGNECNIPTQNEQLSICVLIPFRSLSTITSLSKHHFQYTAPWVHNVNTL